MQKILAQLAKKDKKNKKKTLKLVFAQINIKNERTKTRSYTIFIDFILIINSLINLKLI